LALFAIYLTVFYSKKLEYGFYTYPNFYEYLVHTIILILPIIAVIILFYNNQTKYEENEKLINEKLRSQLFNYETEIKKIHEKYVKLSMEADEIIIKFNDIVEKLINNQIRELDKSDLNRELLIQQMFYDLANPIRVKLSNLKTITITAIKSLKDIELKNEFIKKEYEELLKIEELKNKSKELINSKKENLINSKKENEDKYKREISLLKEKIGNLEFENQRLHDEYQQKYDKILYELKKLQEKKEKPEDILDILKELNRKIEEIKKPQENELFNILKELEEKIKYNR
jgi:fumarate reductase subunit C